MGCIGSFIYSMVLLASRCFSLVTSIFQWNVDEPLNSSILNILRECVWLDILEAVEKVAKKYSGLLAPVVSIHRNIIYIGAFSGNNKRAAAVVIS